MAGLAEGTGTGAGSDGRAARRLAVTRPGLTPAVVVAPKNSLGWVYQFGLSSAVAGVLPPRHGVPAAPGPLPQAATPPRFFLIGEALPPWRHRQDPTITRGGVSCPDGDRRAGTSPAPAKVSAAHGAGWALPSGTHTTLPPERPYNNKSRPGRGCAGSTVMQTLETSLLFLGKGAEQPAAKSAH